MESNLVTRLRAAALGVRVTGNSGLAKLLDEAADEIEGKSSYDRETQTYRLFCTDCRKHVPTTFVSRTPGATEIFECPQGHYIYIGK